METKKTYEGWVVTAPSIGETDIKTYSFFSSRGDSIVSFIEFMNIWRVQPWNWRKYKRKGYKCVRAKQTTEIY